MHADNLSFSYEGKIAARALIYYFLSTFVAVVVGIALVILIKPGRQADAVPTTPSALVEKNSPQTIDTILDLIRYFVKHSKRLSCEKGS